MKLKKLIRSLACCACGTKRRVVRGGAEKSCEREQDTHREQAFFSCLVCQLYESQYS